MIKKSRICDARLLNVVTAFNKLLADEHFLTLLRAESLETMPKFLWSKLTPSNKTNHMSNAKIGFEMKKIRLLLENILPVRQITEAQKKANRYETILASLKVVGLVEPLVVFPQKGQPGKYMLVNGHLRYFAMKELGMTAADCIIANDDECFTYNARISRLPAIQEHKMISRAVKNGASLERIAAALNISTQGVKASLNLLIGIMP